MLKMRILRKDNSEFKNIKIFESAAESWTQGVF